MANAIISCIESEPTSPRWHRRHFWWRRRPRDTGPLRRNVDDRVLGGVAGGIARRFGWDPIVVRVVVVLMMLGGGTGFVGYAGAWIFLPADGEATSIGQRAIHDRRAIAIAVASGIAMVAVVLALSALGLSFAGTFVWSTMVAIGGLGIVWLQGAEHDRDAMRRLAGQLPDLPGFDGRSRRIGLARTAAGGLLILAGIIGLFVLNHTHGPMNRGVAVAAGILAGFALLFGPFWLRLASDLTEERRARVRSQERADMAAHLHDSVLQTLALIQRRADDPREVTRLARAQERDLRAWLFDGDGRPNNGAGTLASAIGDLERDVESLHGVPVETVVVGDAPLDDHLVAIVAAAREATVNSARWSGAGTVSVFAEVEDGSVSVFVRDRGHGFDPESVEPDRRGIAESIRGRMRRHGGTAAIRSAPGDGTEVELTMPRPDKS